MEKERRQQTERITIRVLPEVKEMLVREASKAGLSLSGLVKFRTCGEVAALMKTRQKRLPADMELLRQILGQLGKIGSNHNQIAHHLNQEKGFDSEKMSLKVTAHRLGELKLILLRAMGVIRR